MQLHKINKTAKDPHPIFHPLCANVFMHTLVFQFIYVSLNVIHLYEHKKIPGLKNTDNPKSIVFRRESSC